MGGNEDRDGLGDGKGGMGDEICLQPTLHL